MITVISTRKLHTQLLNLLMTYHHTRGRPDAAILGLVCFRTSQVLLAPVFLDIRFGFNGGAAIIIVFAVVVARVRVLPAGAVLQLEFTLIDSSHVTSLPSCGALRRGDSQRAALVPH